MSTARRLAAIAATISGWALTLALSPIIMLLGKPLHHRARLRPARRRAAAATFGALLTGAA